MEPHQQAEWHELGSRTWDLLRRREHILRSRHRPLLQYLVMPSFSDTWCVDIVETGQALASYQTVWRMTEDLEAFSTAIARLQHPRPYIPTLASTLLPLDGHAIGEVLARFEQLSIPLRRTRNSISLDGVSFELQIGDGGTGITLQWHNVLPDEWPTELASLISDLKEIADQRGPSKPGRD